MKNVNYNFDDFDYTPMEDIQLIESDNEIIKVWARKIEFEDIYQEREINGKYVAKSYVWFYDLEENHVKSSEISRRMYLRLREYEKKIKPVEVLAKVVKAEVKSRFINVLKLLNLRDGDLPLSQLQASRLEIELVKRILANILIKSSGSRWGLFEALKEAVIEKLEIVGTDVDELYSDSINAMICQAVSGGMVRNTNGKINTCIIGPPAAGKKLLWQTAKMLNVVSQEAQAIRVTPAGITAGISKDLPLGLIPLANGGVFGLQDFDKSDKKHELLSIFGDVMEDGKCILAGVTKAEFKARTAIHIDINRFSDLYLDESARKNVTNDTSLPINILSRFDFIAEFRKDPNLQAEKATQLLENYSYQSRMAKGVISEYCLRNQIELERFLKLIVAFIMTEFEQINMTPIDKYMKARFLEIWTVNKQNISKLPEISAFQMRLANSFVKFVHALTRLQLFTDSNRDAVDKALHLLSHKLDFLKNINSEFLVPRFRTTGEDAFRRWLYQRYGDNIFSPAKAIQQYEKANFPCGRFSERTLRYWIEKMAEKTKHDGWKIKAQFVKMLSVSEDEL